VEQIAEGHVELQARLEAGTRVRTRLQSLLCSSFGNITVDYAILPLYSRHPIHSKAPYTISSRFLFSTARIPHQSCGPLSHLAWAHLIWSK